MDRRDAPVRADRAVGENWAHCPLLHRLRTWVVHHATVAVHRKWVATQNWAAAADHRNVLVPHCSDTSHLQVVAEHRVHVREAAAKVSACE